MDDNKWQTGKYRKQAEKEEDNARKNRGGGWHVAPYSRKKRVRARQLQDKEDANKKRVAGSPKAAGVAKKKTTKQQARKYVAGK